MVFSVSNVPEVLFLHSTSHWSRFDHKFSVFGKLLASIGNLNEIISFFINFVVSILPLICGSYQTKPSIQYVTTIIKML